MLTLGELAITFRPRCVSFKTNEGSYSTLIVSLLVVHSSLTTLAHYTLRADILMLEHIRMGLLLPLADNMGPFHLLSVLLSGLM